MPDELDPDSAWLEGSPVKRKNTEEIHQQSGLLQPEERPNEQKIKSELDPLE